MNRWELFDLGQDPNKLINLYGKQGYEKLSAELKIRLEELKKEYKMDKTLAELRNIAGVRVKRIYIVEDAN